MKMKTADGKPLKIGKDYWITDDKRNPPDPPQRMMFSEYTARYKTEISAINQPQAPSQGQPACGQSACNPCPSSPAIATSSPSSTRKTKSTRIFKVEEIEETVITNRNETSNLQVVSKSRRLDLIFRNSYDAVEIDCTNTATVECAFDSYEKAHENYLSRLLENSYRTQEIVDKVRSAITASQKQP
jgi:hypothetical protein